MTADELKKLAEAESLTGAQLVGMSGPEFAEAQRLKQQFRQIHPAAILKLLAINAELVEALKGLEEAYCRSGSSLTRDERTEDRKRLMYARAALAKAEGGEL